MSRFFRKHYHSFISVILLILLVLWTNLYQYDFIGMQEVSGEVSSNSITADSLPSPDTTDPNDNGVNDIPATEGSETVDPTAVSELTVEPEITSGPELTAMPTPTAEPLPTAGPTPTEAPEPTPTEAPEPTPTEIPEPTPTPAPYEFNYVFVDVDSILYMRSGPSRDYKRIAYFGSSSYAELLEKGTEWSRISSGGFVGYSTNSFLLFGQEAISKIRSLGALKITVSSAAANIYSATDYSSEVIAETTQGYIYEFLPEYSNTEWYAVELDGLTAYIPSADCQVSIDLNQAVSVQ